MTILEHAKHWHHLGYVPLPTRVDGSKAPAVSWRTWQHQHPTPADVDAMFAIDTDGLGIITGATSGGLEMLELEGRAIKEGLLPKLVEAFNDHTLGDLWAKIAGGYVEVTPSGGIHYCYRTETAKPNTKLARRPSTPDELVAHPGARVQVLIETRGEGGFTVIAPSAGRTHPNHKAWTAVVGTPETIPTITNDERDTIYSICALFDEVEDPALAPAANLPATTNGELRPGDDYNSRTTWDDILTPHGWTKLSQRGTQATWLRPGKTRGQGISATTGRNDADNLYVFSTSTEFQAEAPYSKFSAFALLEHGGDHSAAAKALRTRGYGTPPAPPTLTLIQGGATGQPQTDGANALAPAPSASTVREITEDALAVAFVDQTVNQLKYCPQRGQWLTWNGARWAWDEAEYHREYIRQLARQIPANDKAWASFRRSALSANGVSAIARLARTDPRIVVHIDQLDAHPWELNTPGGIINLRTGQLTPARPEQLHTRSTTVTPDFDMPSPIWDKFLADTFGRNGKLIGFMQRLAGQAMIGTVTEQLLAFLYGGGANGKSTYVETKAEVVGRGTGGYSITAPAEMLMARRHSEHPAELAQLSGARMVLCSELEDGQRFAESRVKQLTGRDSINARFMRENPFTFTPTHTFFLAANHKPQTTTGGPAFWRRIKLIPFNHVVPEAERDPELPDKLRAEHPAILAWIARGAAAYAEGGLQVPEIITRATEDYQHDEDTIKQFVEEYCHLAPGNPHVQTTVPTLRAAYEKMCHETGDEPSSARRLTQELRDRWGVEVSRTNTTRIYKGIALMTSEGDETELRYK